MNLNKENKEFDDLQKNYIFYKTHDCYVFEIFGLNLKNEVNEDVLKIYLPIKRSKIYQESDCT